MTESRRELKNHVSAAKEWLGKAEQSLEKENDIKGNLNLMLAQAELARAYEKKAIKRTYKSLLIHSMLAAGIVGLAVVFGFGGASGGKEAVAVKATVLPQLIQPAIADDKAKSAEMEAKMPRKEDAGVNVPLKDNNVATEQARSFEAIKADSKETVKVNRQDAVAVSPARMQQLLRAAGKSLRGQE